MKMIRRFCLLAALLLLALGVTANADVVMGNEFFYENESRTESVDYSRFIVNSPEGYAIPREEPGSGKGISTEWGYSGHWSSESFEAPKWEVFVFQNGEIIYIDATYLHNGRYWGVMSPSHVYQPPGWIPMDELLVIYGGRIFEEENSEFFSPYNGSYDFSGISRLVVWQWPGADREKWIVEDRERIATHYSNLLYVYKDMEGREWGGTGSLGSWICLSDPENSDIPAFYPAPAPTNWVPGGDYDWSADITVYPAKEPPGTIPLRGSSIPDSVMVVVLIAGLLFAMVFWTAARKKEP